MFCFMRRKGVEGSDISSRCIPVYGIDLRFSTFVTLWTPQKFLARVADPTAQGALASTFRTPGWARTCLTKIAYPNDLNL